MKRRKGDAMKRRTFFSALGALCALPFVGKSKAIPVAVSSKSTSTTCKWTIWYQEPGGEWKELGISKTTPTFSTVPPLELRRK
jgi:hypothetical protein